MMAVSVSDIKLLLSMFSGEAELDSSSITLEKSENSRALTDSSTSDV